MRIIIHLQSNIIFQTGNTYVRTSRFDKQIFSFGIVLNILQEINPAKAAGIDKIGGRFLQDGAPVWQIQSKNCVIFP